MALTIPAENVPWKKKGKDRVWEFVGIKTWDSFSTHSVVHQIGFEVDGKLHNLTLTFYQDTLLHMKSQDPDFVLKELCLRLSREYKMPHHVFFEEIKECLKPKPKKGMFSIGEAKVTLLNGAGGYLLAAGPSQIKAHYGPSTPNVVENLSRKLPGVGAIVMSPCVDTEEGCLHKAYDYDAEKQTFNVKMVKRREPFKQSLWMMVQHLNDVHKWSREKIADWIDELHDSGQINAEFQPWGEEPEKPVQKENPCAEIDISGDTIEGFSPDDTLEEYANKMEKLAAVAKATDSMFINTLDGWKNLGYTTSDATISYYDKIQKFSGKKTEKLITDWEITNDN